VIADILENLDRYRGLDPRLDRGLEALRRLVGNPPSADGRHELEGEDLFASFSTYEAGSPAKKLFEAHRRYIDIQAVLRGRELLYWAPLAGLASRSGYSETEDIAMYGDPPAGGAGLTLEPGAFVVLFPQDAHKPGCQAAGGGRTVRKLVLKVRV
jgi:biofilm protein TabA